MQVFHHRSSDHNMPKLHNVSPEDILLFDIETTGLSPELSTLFMIGCGYYSEDKLHTIHWLADDLTLQSEQDILKAFSQWMDSHYHSNKEITLITYNGDTFDLPFIKKRIEECQLKDLFKHCKALDHSVDFYRQISSYKHLWPVKNLKLHTVSSWLGYKNSKTPSGRGLIKTYHAYIKEKDPALLNLLFLHNIDDIEGLSKVLSMDIYREFATGKYHIQSLNFSSRRDHLIFKILPDQTFPAKINYEKFDIQLELDDSVTLTIPVYERGLRYYYQDYKNYIYLISEDYALHKTMATYIDKSNWIKATEESCYTWFLPDDNFFNDPIKQKDYIQMVLKLFGLV